MEMDKDQELPGKPLSVNPFRMSQPLGGVLALQGVYRSIPIVHNAQGCVESIKTILTKHYREPTSIHHIPIHDHNLIFGGSKKVYDVIDLAMSKFKPDAVVLIGTSLTEVVGEDLSEAVKLYHKQNPNEVRNKLLLSVNLPEYAGSMESGYASTVEALIRGIIGMNMSIYRKRQRDRINLLIGPHLTPGDVMELKEIISSFGLEVIAVPDLSSSLAGHLLTGHTALSRGGVPLDQLMEICTAGFTIAVGHCMENAALLLKDFMEIPYHVFPGLMGLKASDELFAFLQDYSNNPVQVKYRWQRQYLLDSMLDTRSVYRGKRVLAALEPDHLASVFAWLSEMGVRSFRSMTTSSSPALEKMKNHVEVGDLEQLGRIADDGADLWIGNSYSEQAAIRKGIAFIPYGFPLVSQFGAPMEVSIGYRGTTDQINRMANILLSVDGRVCK